MATTGRAGDEAPPNGIPRPSAVELAAAEMQAAARTFDRAYHAGADRGTLAVLRAAHNRARGEWLRARAAAGDTQAAVLVAFGAA
jgi:hypothetical protein